MNRIADTDREDFAETTPMVLHWHRLESESVRSDAVWRLRCASRLIQSAPGTAFARAHGIAGALGRDPTLRSRLPEFVAEEAARRLHAGGAPAA
jgi:hypothetical protein